MPLQPDPLAQISVGVSAIMFAMLDGEKRVLCEVELVALQDQAIVDGADERDFRGTFMKHREKIQKIASRNYDAGEQLPRVTTYQLVDLP